MINIQLKIKNKKTDLTVTEARALYNDLKALFEEITYTYPRIFEDPPIINPTMPYYTSPFYDTGIKWDCDLLKENKV